MTALLEVLAEDRAKNLFSVNLGEKRDVTCEGWTALLSFVTHGNGRCHIRYIFVDSNEKGIKYEKEYISKLKQGIRELRNKDCEEATPLPIWKLQSTVDRLRKDCPHYSTIEQFMAKPFYHYKKNLK